MRLLPRAPPPFVLVARNRGPFPQFREQRETFPARGKTVRCNFSNRSSTSFPRVQLCRPLFPEQPAFRTQGLCVLPTPAKSVVPFRLHPANSLGDLLLSRRRYRKCA